MTLVAYAFTVWVLLSGDALARGRSPAAYQASGQAAPHRVTLSNDDPEGSFVIPPEILAKPPAVLALTMTQVINPAKTPFQVFVYLSCQPGSAETGRAAPAKILVGNVALYPPDRPAGFLLRASTAFRKLKAARSNPTDVRLLLEMKRIHPAKPWTRVEVTAAPPEWRRTASQP